METTYYPVVEQTVDGKPLRTLDEYATTRRLVGDAADYEAGDFPGRWVGAFELSFDASGRVVAAHPLPDIAADVHTELLARSEWRHHQAALERWQAR